MTKQEETLARPSEKISNGEISGKWYGRTLYNGVTLSMFIQDESEIQETRSGSSDSDKGTSD